MSLSQETINTLISDAHYIFNNPPGESSQEVRDVIEWFAGSLGVDAARTQPAPVTSVDVPRLTDEQLLAMWAGNDERALRPVLGGKKIIAYGRAIEAALIAKWSKT